VLCRIGNSALTSASFAHCAAKAFSMMAVARSVGSVLGFMALSSVPAKFVAWTVPFSLGLLMLASLVASFQTSLFHAPSHHPHQEKRLSSRDNLAMIDDVAACNSSCSESNPEVLSAQQGRVAIRLAILSNYPGFVEPLLAELSGAEVDVDVVLVSGTNPALADMCLQKGVSFCNFPKCPDGSFFVRSCRDLPEYRAKVEDVYDVLRACEPDVLLTVGFYVLPADALAIPAKAAINMHPADLPRYRGGMPLEAHILRGEPSFRICVHRTTEMIDDPRHILATSDSQPLGPQATVASMHTQIASAVPPLVLQALRRLEPCGAAAEEDKATAEEESITPLAAETLPHAFGVRGELIADPSGGATAAKSNAGVLGRARIEWEEDSAADIERAARAFVGGVGLYTDYEGTTFAVQKVSLDGDASAAEASSSLPGTLLEFEHDSSEGLLCARVATCDRQVIRLFGHFSQAGAPALVDSAHPSALRIGGCFRSTTPLSSLLGRSGVDRLPGGTRYA